MAKKIDIANSTGIPELDLAISATSKKFGKDLSGENYGNVLPIPTGSLLLDIALGIGGVPRARITEIVGPNGSMKTSLALAIIYQMQQIRKRDGITAMDLFIDLEHSLTTDFIESFGIDMSLVIWKRPDTIEEALQMCIDFPKTGYIDGVLFDSVDAGQNERQLRRNIGDIDVGGTSKDMNTAIRQISKICATTNTTYLFINQIKMNPGVMFGSPETTTGGLALGYYAVLRLKMMPKEKFSEIPRSAIMRIKVLKTKIAFPWEDPIKCAFMFAKGFNEAYDTEAVAKAAGLLRHSVGQTKVRWGLGSEPEPLLPEIGKGKAAGQKCIRENAFIRRRLREACLRAYKIKSAVSDAEVIAMFAPEEEEGVAETVEATEEQL